MTGPDRRKRKRLYNALAGVASVVVAVVYVVSLGISPKHEDSDDGQISSKKTNTPGKVATGLEIFRFNDQGQLSHILTAEKAEYFHTEGSVPPAQPNLVSASVNQDFTASQGVELDAGEFSDDNFDTPYEPSINELIRLSKPTVVLYRDDNHAIRGYSQQGYLLPAMDRVEMIGEVMINDSKTESFLYSQSLTINTVQKQVYTHDSVKLLNPQSLTTARGLQGNFIQERWQFLGEVRSTINPGQAASRTQ